MLIQNLLTLIDSLGEQGCDISRLAITLTVASDSDKERLLWAFYKETHAASFRPLKLQDMQEPTIMGVPLHIEAAS